MVKTLTDVSQSSHATCASPDHAKAESMHDDFTMTFLPRSESSKQRAESKARKAWARRTWRVCLPNPSALLKSAGVVSSGDFVFLLQEFKYPKSGLRRIFKLVSGFTVFDGLFT